MRPATSSGPATGRRPAASRRTRPAATTARSTPASGRSPRRRRLSPPAGSTTTSPTRPSLAWRRPRPRPTTGTPFSDGNVRIYVLDAAWSDGAAYLNTTSATGSACPGNQSECEGYQIEAAEHWGQSSKEMTWLKQDLAAHPSQIKFAVFHYPLTSLQTDQQSDVYLDTTLEPVLKGAGVSMAFDGHAHTYQRFVPNAGSSQLISYVSGGGGGVLEPVDGNTETHGLCAAALRPGQCLRHWLQQQPGLRVRDGQRPGQRPFDHAGQVYNFLKVNGHRQRDHGEPHQRARAAVRQADVHVSEE